MTDAGWRTCASNICRSYYARATFAAHTIGYHPLSLVGQVFQNGPTPGGGSTLEACVPRRRAYPGIWQSVLASAPVEARIRARPPQSRDCERFLSVTRIFAHLHVACYAFAQMAALAYDHQALMEPNQGFQRKNQSPFTQTGVTVAILTRSVVHRSILTEW